MVSSLLSALDRKLLRDLLHLRGQAFAIALIIASGVGVLLMSLITVDSLQESSETYYQRYRFADVFASAKRAPLGLLDRISAIPGVQVAESRVVELATLDITGFVEPVIASLISVPGHQQPQLNQLVIRKGRYLDIDRANEVILHEPFAQAHNLQPGDQITALINGRKQRLEIVGIALSPEFIYAMGPGALMPDDLRYGIVWMSNKTLSAALDLEGAFNDVTLTLWRGAKTAQVVRALDDLLAPYGGVGAIERKNQISNWFLSNEIQQLNTMATILPSIFFIVAAFLTNTVLARLIVLERGEIGLLKAFGYRNASVVWHYAKLILLITAVGIVIGWLIGIGLGRWQTIIYAENYRFPILYIELNPQVFVLSAVICFVVSMLGALGAVRLAVRLAPAEAMRPPAPTRFSHSVTHPALSRAFAQAVDQPTRILLRNLGRSPIRSGLTAFGVAAAIGLLVLSMQWIDAIDYLVEDYFFVQQHQNMVISLYEATNNEVVQDILHLPGILAAEPRRAVAVRLHNGHRNKRESLSGLAPNSKFEILRDVNGDVVNIPREGLLVSSMLAKLLKVSVGDSITVEVLQDSKPTTTLPVAQIFETFIGSPVYIDQRVLNRLMQEPPVSNMLYVKYDPAQQTRLFQALKNTPKVGAITLQKSAVNTFHDTMGDTILVYVFFYVVFSCMLMFGVIYNNMRIALSERGRELATLRVLGFRVGEISYMLIGEAAILLLIGLPLGCGAGWALSSLMLNAFESELFRVPLVIEPSTFGIAIVIAVITSIFTAILIRQRLGNLDLIAVLKTRE